MIIPLAKTLSFLSRRLNIGHGSTWPGHIALSAKPNFITEILSKNKHLKIILIAGTNGKTTTSKLLRFILEKNSFKVFQNESGANLLNGIASSLIIHTDLNGKLNYHVAIFEIDENTLPLIINHIKPNVLVLLNLFRDQLDRYGEVNSIAKKWHEALHGLSRLHLNEGVTLTETQLFVNGNDPQLTFLAEKSGLKTYYFGIDKSLMTKKPLSHDVDFTHCPKCKEKLLFEKISYSHMGIFKCPKCNFTNKKIEHLNISHYPLFGLYNHYNINAAFLVAAKVFKISEKSINSAMREFKPAFGRQEVIVYKGKKIIILLSKNPTSFNQSLQAVSEQKGKYLLLVLNDRVPDGRDVSWIWDVDFEEYLNEKQHIHVSGDRTYDMALRIKYAHPVVKHIDMHELLDRTIDPLIEEMPEKETLYILPTYSAMLEVRKILTGKKIL